jgi:hypothetical protein
MHLSVPGDSSIIDRCPLSALSDRVVLAKCPLRAQKPEIRRESVFDPEPNIGLGFHSDGVNSSPFSVARLSRHSARSRPRLMTNGLSCSLRWGG